MKGLELSERFFEEYGRAMLTEQFAEYEGVIAAGIAGEGSDCFGYDDEVSRDHDFEAGFCLWIPDALQRELEFKLSRAYAKLPAEYLGIKRNAQSLGGGGRRGVMLTGDFYRRFTGRPGVPESLREWLELPEYGLACAGNGKVFRDALGEFSAIRETLKKGYPEDVRKKKIAARAVVMAQSGQYNFMRCIRHGEPGAAVIALNEFVKNGLSMLFLLNNRYMPYYKWAFRAARELPALSETVAVLEGLLLMQGRAAERDIEEGIESVCASALNELRRQRLTDGPWEYLEPHAFEIQEQICDGELRNLHVMIG